MQLLPSVIHESTAEHTEMADSLVGAPLPQLCVLGPHYLFWWSYSGSLKEINYLGCYFYIPCLLQLCCLLSLPCIRLPVTVSPLVMLTFPLYLIRKQQGINVFTRF